MGVFSCYLDNIDFYPRSPCGERLYMGVTVLGIQHISIHALLAESDQMEHLKIPAHSDFYPRSPCGERLFFVVSDSV